MIQGTSLPVLIAVAEAFAVNVTTPAITPPTRKRVNRKAEPGIQAQLVKTIQIHVRPLRPDRAATPESVQKM